MFVDAIPMSKKVCKFPIKVKLAYATRENFLGRVVDGYKNTHVCLLSPKTAQALCEIQNTLNNRGLGVFVFDAYRPLRAVKDFANWVTSPITDPYEWERKELHFPHLRKEDLVPKGYIADTVSEHCFGNVVDLTIMDLETGQFLDMGTIFDYFGELSHHHQSAEAIGKRAAENRALLLKTMEEHGFASYPYEYWHFSYKEKEIDTPQDFVII